MLHLGKAHTPHYTGLILEEKKACQRVWRSISNFYKCLCQEIQRKYFPIDIPRLSSIFLRRVTKKQNKTNMFSQVYLLQTMEIDLTQHWLY